MRIGNTFLVRPKALGVGCTCSTFSAVLLIAVPANADSGSELTVSASTAYDSNPFLSFNDDPEVASFRLELVPTVYQSDEVSSIRASARIEHVEYARLYDSVDNLALNLAVQRDLSERLNAGASLSVSSTVTTTDFNGPTIGFGEPEPSVPTSPIFDDVTLFADRQRRNLAAVDASVQFKLSEFDDLRWSSSVRAQRYNSARLNDSDFAMQRAEFSRRISEYVVLGGGVEASVSNFKSTRVGDAKTLSPQVSARARIFPRVDFSGRLGVSITRTQLVVGRETSTSISGNASLCHSGVLSNFCLNAARQVLPSAIGGVRKQSTIGTAYSLRLSERENVQLGGSYAVASAPLSGSGGKFESIRSYARYERQLDERLRLFASAGYSNSSDDLEVRRSNFQGAVGISVKIGRAK
ncbi:hypothetical protein [Allopontixanthobacter sediminis]|uniref:Beta-barrel porin 2 n=1 Tax=Allopontixanthobacter sediminis TaxID=1689985 RepID=A0A845B019_9SPHN|nr:hypothetical protein [Allopontixanthobacter sediminis]MXP44631.1 hypothetical protein [Allopontixanthobacter sediminis]